ncbi:MAG: PAS domain-containing protein, partial [Planctomycetaceae bacterium]|nr:PAS domain-containing protein [Planctomycetaceae bacterium]
MRENKRLKREIARMETMIERTKALQQTHLSYESEVQSEYIRQGKFFDFFLQKSPNIIIMLDNDGRFVYASKKLLDKMKIPAFGFLGAKKFSDMFMAEEYTPLRETIQAAIADKTAKEITLRTKWKADKEETDYVVNFLPMLTANTETEGLIIFAQDITEIIAAKDEAERATRVKSSFLANMSHEIRTPMNAVIGLADLLLREPLSEKAMDMAADIHQAGSSLLAIINDILDFSKIESGKMEIVEADYQLNLLLSELFNVLRPKLLESPLKLIVNVDKTL